MNYFFNRMKIEGIKVVSSKPFWIIIGLVIIMQPLLALMNAKELVRMGLDATPISNPDLVQAIPAIEYIGFYDIVPFGLLPVVVLGGIIGSSEYRNHNLRTTLLYDSNRTQLFVAKTIVVFIGSMIISFVSIYLTIVATHVGLNQLGLHPFVLSSTTWQYIAYASMEWTLLITLSYFIGMLARNVIVPLLFLISQIYGLAPFLAERWELAENLPVYAGKLLTAIPTDTFAHEPVRGGLILGVWILIIGSLSMYTFVRKDVGGRY